MRKILVITFLVMTFAFLYTGQATMNSVPISEKYDAKQFAFALNNQLSKNGSKVKIVDCEFAPNLQYSNYPGLKFYRLLFDNPLKQDLACQIAVNNAGGIMEIVVAGPSAKKNQQKYMYVLDVLLSSLETFGWSRDSSMEFIGKVFVTPRKTSLKKIGNINYGLICTVDASAVAFRLLAFTE